MLKMDLVKEHYLWQKDLKDTRLETQLWKDLKKKRGK